MCQAQQDVEASLQESLCQADPDSEPDMDSVKALKAIVDSLARI